MKRYLIDFEHLVNRQIELLKAEPITKANKSLILEFKDFNLLNSVSLPRIVRQIGTLRLIALFIKKDFSKATKKDFETLILWLQKKGYSEETIDTHKKILKVFYKWMNNGEYPDTVKWIKASPLRSKKLPEELLTEEEVKNLIDVCQHKRDKAFIAALWESGARIGEIGTIQIRHVTFDDFGCQLTMDGKTGMRRVRLVASAPYILDWINAHPSKTDPQAPLWQNFQRNLGKRSSHSIFMKILKSARNRTKITKPINPHHFRHSRATYLAQFLTEAQMKEYFGWVQNSDSAARYVHLSGKQVDDAILGVYGLRKKEEQASVLKRNPCPRCKVMNDVNHQYCEKCWLPLTPSALNEIEEIRKKDQQAMVSAMKLIAMSRNDPTIIERAIKQAEEESKTHA